MCRDHCDDDKSTLGLAPAALDAGGGVPRASRYDDVYFSADGGLAESEHVFIRGNDLPSRWADWSARRAFVIVETGFGAGLNALLAWRMFRAIAPPSARLQIVSIEKHPLSATDLERIWIDWPSMADEAARLDALWPDPIRGTHRRALDERVTLDLVFDDVESALALFDGRADAWFLDGFAPARNPRMWQPRIFETMAAASRSGATFATYSCAGAVRRGLIGAGFECHRRPGFGRKRDMLAGYLRNSEESGKSHPPDRRPWFYSAPALPAARVAIVGAGIAGATTAEALARRGCEVRVFDPNGVAGGASGNRQAALYIRPSAAVDRRTRFYLAAMNYTLAWLARLDPTRALWSDCGLLQLALDERDARRQRRCSERLALPANTMRWVDVATASNHAGVRLGSAVGSGLFYPRAGWVRPDALCRLLIERAGLTVVEQTVIRIFARDEMWQVELADGSREAFDQVVLACGAAASRLTEELPPLTAVRGQVSLFDLNEKTRRRAPRCVVCGRGYATPELADCLSVGASFVPAPGRAGPRRAEDRDNLETLAETMPDLAARLDSAKAAARVGWRCTSHDRFPCVGPVPDSAAWRRDYAALARDAKSVVEATGAVRPGLWASTAHGAQGLVSAPLAAEMLAARICDEPMPLPADLVDALHPGRWLIKEIVRGRY